MGRTKNLKTSTNFLGPGLSNKKKFVKIGRKITKLQLVLQKIREIHVCCGRREKASAGPTKVTSRELML